MIPPTVVSGLIREHKGQNATLFAMVQAREGVASIARFQLRIATSLSNPALTKMKLLETIRLGPH